MSNRGTLSDAFRAEPDFEVRDPNNINSDGLLVAFEDVLAEPDHTQSSACAWKCAYRCYRVWKMLCYSIFTTCCSWAFGCYWGCQFGVTAINYIWNMTPLCVCFTIEMSNLRRRNQVLADACIGPLCSAIGNFFDAFHDENGVGQQKAM